MRVIPAILSEGEADFREKVRLVAGFTDYAQIDFMDGDFVPSRSVSAPAAGRVSIPVDYEAHLMVSDPLEWLDHLRTPRLKKVIFHYEAVRDPAAVARRIEELGFVPGLALNPGTAAEEAASIYPSVKGVLVMTVHPGFYGSPFVPEALDKVARIQGSHPELKVGIDGGVSLDNLHLARKAGVDYACVGSRILLADDPAASFSRFRQTASAAAT